MNRHDPAPSIWLVTDTGRKIAKGTLDRTTIARAALALLDAEGLDALTMRGLGDRLRVSAMACYAHVRHKDDVLELAQDQAMAELTVPTGDWADVLGDLAQSYRLLLVEHPWLPVLAGRFLNAGPAVRRLTTQASSALVAGGLPADRAALALSAVFTLAHGFGAIEAAWRTRLNDRAALDEITGRMAELDPTDPVLAHRAAAGTQASSDAEWHFALQALISGITHTLKEDP